MVIGSPRSFICARWWTRTRFGTGTPPGVPLAAGVEAGVCSLIVVRSPGGCTGAPTRRAPHPRGPTHGRPRSAPGEGTGVVGDVDGVLEQGETVDHLQGPLVRRGEHDGCRRPGPVGLQPAGGHDAPAHAGLEAGEGELRARGDEVVAEPPLVVEELGGDDDAHAVTAGVAGARHAAARPVVPGHRVRPALLERSAQDVALRHASMMAGRRSAGRALTVVRPVPGSPWTRPDRRRRPPMPVLTDLLAALRTGAVEVVDLTAPLTSQTPILELPEQF